MEEFQEPKHVCKICGKCCLSGKSLGGHMRVHSALISAMKKADEEDDDFENFKNRSNTVSLDQEEIKNGEINVGFGDDDSKTSYELRENPKKSWKKFDPKNGDSSSRNATCKECGKIFPSVRALSGHMRCHSIKKKTLSNQNHCKECGKGFDSVKALFGHMKTHSKKSRISDEAAESSSSELNNLCPLRRKRSKIIYKVDPTPSPSEVEEVALCLLMLSKGVKNWDSSNSCLESSVCKEQEIDMNDSGDGLVLDKHLPHCDDMISGSSFFSRNEMKVMKSSCYDKAIVGDPDVDKKCRTLKVLDSGPPVEVVEAGFECPICLRVFSSGQALGGHKRAHYMGEKSIESSAMDYDFDLNVPIASGEGEEDGIGDDQWWVETVHGPKEETMLQD